MCSTLLQCGACHKFCTVLIPFYCLLYPIIMLRACKTANIETAGGALPMDHDLPLRACVCVFSLSLSFFIYTLEQVCLLCQFCAICCTSPYFFALDTYIRRSVWGANKGAIKYDQMSIKCTYHDGFSLFILCSFQLTAKMQFNLNRYVRLRSNQLNVVHRLGAILCWRVQ